jgi:preprotein translocase subunit SecD
MKRVGAVLALVVLLLAAGCGGSKRCTAELILRAVPARGQRVTPGGMQTARRIIGSRLDGLGVSSPSVTLQGRDEIVIRFGGAGDLPSVAQSVLTPGRLEMFDFEPSLAPPTVRGNQQAAPLPSLYDLLKAVQKDADKGTPQAYYLFKTKAPHAVVQGPAPSLQQLFVSSKGGKQPPGTEVLKVPARREPVSCSGTADCLGAGSNGTFKAGEYWYLFKLPPALTGADIVNSSVSADVDQNTGRPIVTLTFTRRGSAAFNRITKAEYDRGRINAGEAGQLVNTSQTAINLFAGHNAIVLDGKLEETPYIDYTDAILSQGIVGNAQITEPSAAAARRTALVLKSGSLPYTFREVELSNCLR